jgi:hypothetical protein
MDKKNYEEACHAMQTGVALAMQKAGGPGAGDTSPKHLRVGVNSAMIQVTALVSVLVKKGVFTLDEYTDTLVEEMNNEVSRYEDELGVRLL